MKRIFKVTILMVSAMIMFSACGSKPAKFDAEKYGKIGQSQLLEMAADGDACAMYQLGINADNPINPSGCIEWYTRAAKGGLKEAQYELGYRLATGVGVKRDFDEAFKWYMASAEQGYGRAMVGVAGCYLYGNGAEKDVDSAVEWLKKAIKTTDKSYACPAMGLCYLNGWGVETNPKEAFKWFQEGYDNRDLLAAKYLGYCYLGGIGVDKDEDKGIMILKIVAREGDSEAIEFLQSIGMTNY